MIFALFIIFVFTGLLAFTQFGGQINVATPKAQLLAENMAVWHQAAMLEIQENGASIAPTSCVFSSGCSIDLNNQLWSGTVATGLLAQYWPGYRPSVPISVTSGWQSYYLRNIDGINPVTANGGRSYVLTVFRGYGAHNNSLVAGSEKGTLDAENFTQGLSKTITERAGMGTLRCAGNECVFTRQANSQSWGTTTLVQDQPLRFRSEVFTNSGLPVPVVNGQSAMMTEVRS
jgi:hypothetical protein